MSETMIYKSSELLSIKNFTTSKISSILTWLNINLHLLKIGCNQTRYVSRGTCIEWLLPLEKSSASLGDNKDRKHLCDQWYGMASCKSPSCCTVNQKTGCLSTSEQKSGMRRHPVSPRGVLLKFTIFLP